MIDNEISAWRTQCVLRSLCIAVHLDWFVSQHEIRQLADLPSRTFSRDVSKTTCLTEKSLNAKTRKRMPSTAQYCPAPMARNWTNLSMSGAGLESSFLISIQNQNPQPTKKRTNKRSTRNRSLAGNRTTGRKEMFYLTTNFVTLVVEHWLEREIAQWVHPMKDRSDNPSHHERTLLPRSYISLPIL